MEKLVNISEPKVSYGTVKDPGICNFPFGYFVLNL